MKEKFIKIEALILAATLALSLAGCSKKKSDPTPVTTYYISMDQIKKGEENASLFNVGNFRIKGKSGLRDILRANKKGIPAGAIINTIAENKGEILLDAEYAKYLVDNADLDYPIYLDVTGLLENNNLRIDEVLELISVFCSKVSGNGMFVGIYGSEEDIEKLKKYDEANILNAYDILLKNDNPDIELDIKSLIDTTAEGTYETSTDIQKLVENKDLNNKDKFTYDLLYSLREGEDLSDIAYSFGLSVNDLLRYNGIKSEKDLKDVTEIRIPTRGTGTSQKTTITKTSGKDPLLGIDISYAQDDQKVDWETLSDKVDFAILRASIGSSKDSTFEYKAAKCAENNIPIGAYCYNNYILPDNLDTFKANVDNQTKAFIDAISGKKITFPAYLDIEKTNGHEVQLTNEQMEYLVDSWYDSMVRIGLKPGIYAGKTNYQYIKDHYKGKHDLDKDFEIWVAGDWEYFNNRGIEYCGGASYEKINSALNENTLNKNDFSSTNPGVYSIQNADMVQITEAGTGFGIGNHTGKVDVDVTFNNYIEQAVEENVISINEAELLKVMTPEQRSKALFEVQKKIATGDFGYGMLAGGSITLIAGYAILRVLAYKKQKERAKRRAYVKRKENR